VKKAYDSLTDRDRAVIELTLAEMSPQVLPSDWRRTDDYANACWYSSRDGLRVCVEVEAHETCLWLHVSMSRRDRDPSYFDMKRIKDLFVGRNRKAVQVFPPDSEHYNYHTHCLHLWACLAGDPLPDFRTAEGQL
jgi:hypothetical protein